ncbi:hypothetical protein NBT05_02590 [Aquimarina sp. ERC-38]|uniref:hypothetical protein n=1 Tax=Aquimarina sp. ERC-38 TaxID=2949996 RepID=UPI002245C140|nr:hypothetical protein [Aquimarina sp. ERC-38]UZO81370.1 hypothetical protein NBT05_02590 [Aquimarina sp. ERC-38]
MKSNAKDSLLEVGKHLSTGVLGMVAGSAVGRYSLALGALTIFGGAYYGKDWVTSAGVGMAFSNGFSKRPQTTNGVDGIRDNLDDAKDRAITSLKAIGKKLYLDKLSPSLAQKMALGDIEDRPLVFMGSEVADTGDFDTGEVDEIIRKIEAGEALPTIDIGQSFTNGTGNDINGIDSMELNGAEDISELNAVA